MGANPTPDTPATLLRIGPGGRPSETSTVGRKRGPKGEWSFLGPNRRCVTQVANTFIVRANLLLDCEN